LRLIFYHEGHMLVTQPVSAYKHLFSTSVVSSVR